ncbi:stemmadenine O-acetyltransferase [Quercus suber]|uniref:Vinorine synthase n=1 Tax=Quercus suber TaxID=58331 RepID=A0AAW0LBW8_QUESU|nr:vinorine synthase-like [Quercus suber]POE55215.1 vinorine synthase [Quercus suber]
MMKVEVTVISKETIKPSLPTLHHLKPYKLTLLDQVTPATYVPTVFFYPMTNLNLDMSQIIAQLKTSLSDTLNIFYPFSGNIKDNLFIHEFDTGVPFVEAHVNCSMSEFLKHLETDLLSLFVPYHAFCKETNTTVGQMAVQLNLFDCGGIAIGLSCSHKIADATTASIFLHSWAATFTRSPEKVIHPNFSEGSIMFPPRDSLPQKYITTMENLWFKEGDYVTRRFVFHEKAIATLRSKAKSELVPKPTRTEALTCFIWKHCMAASKAESVGPKNKSMTILVQAVNLRTRMKPHMSDASTGNIFWWAPTAADLAMEEKELHELVGFVNESITGFDSDSAESLQGDEGFLAFSNFFDEVEDIFSAEPKPDVCAVTCWLRFFNDIDFGWGKPFWVGIMGKVGPAFRNLIILSETPWGDGTEAWVTLEEKEMAILENDPKFLACASLNPSISISL